MAPGILEMAQEMFKELYIPAEKDILAAQLKFVCYKSRI
jgi:hypothetical protein